MVYSYYTRLKGDEERRVCCQEAHWNLKVGGTRGRGRREEAPEALGSSFLIYLFLF